MRTPLPMARRIEKEWGNSWTLWWPMPTLYRRLPQSLQNSKNESSLSVAVGRNAAHICTHKLWDIKSIKSRKRIFKIDIWSKFHEENIIVKVQIISLNFQRFSYFVVVGFSVPRRPKQHRKKAALRRKVALSALVLKEHGSGDIYVIMLRNLSVTKLVTEFNVIKTRRGLQSAKISLIHSYLHDFIEVKSSIHKSLSLLYIWV